MKNREFYEKAQELRDKYQTHTFKGRVICMLVSEFFSDSEIFLKEISIRWEVGYEYREEFSNELLEVLGELSISCDECWSYDGRVFIIRGAKFK